MVASNLATLFYFHETQIFQSGTLYSISFLNTDQGAVAGKPLMIPQLLIKELIQMHRYQPKPEI